MAFKLSPNELYMRMTWFYTQNKHAVNPENGRKTLVKVQKVSRKERNNG